jgi:hypothetical protein
MYNVTMRRVRVHVMFVPPLLYEVSDTISLEQSAFIVTFPLVTNTQVRFHVKWPIFLYILYKICILFTVLHNGPQYKISQISSCADICGGTDAHDEGNKALFATLQSPNNGACVEGDFFFFSEKFEIVMTTDVQINTDTIHA